MAHLPSRKTSTIDLRQLAWNVFAGVVAAAVVSWLGARFEITVVVGATVLSLWSWYVNQGPRRRQAALARVLTEASSSRSAAEALRVLSRELRDGGSIADTMAAMQLLSHYRRYPHSTLLAVPQLLLSNNSSDSRSEAAHVMELSLCEMEVARDRVKHELAEYVLTIPSNATLVLYGYSSTVLDALEISAKQISHPIWVIEDLQYGEASVEEHILVARRLRELQLAHSVLSFDAFTRCTGQERADSVNSIDGRRIFVTHSGGFVGLLGCDASDDSGACLVPGVTAGKASETAKFVEQFGRALDGDGPRRLVVASESYKMIESCRDAEKTTHAPLRTPMWVRLMHLAGFAIPFRGREVHLLCIKDQVQAIVSDRGTCEAPFDTGELSQIRQRWAERLASDLKRTDRQVYGGTRAIESARTHAGDGQVEMSILTNDLVRVCRELPPLPRPKILPPSAVDLTLSQRLLPLILEGFPERNWDVTTIGDTVLTPANLRAVFLFEAGHRVVGVVTFHATATPGQGRLHWLAVTEKLRRRGYGLALVASLAEEAERLGVTTIVLTTEAQKTAAIALYDKLGFQHFDYKLGAPYAPSTGEEPRK